MQSERSYLVLSHSEKIFDGDTYRHQFFLTFLYIFENYYILNLIYFHDKYHLTILPSDEAAVASHGPASELV